MITDPLWYRIFSTSPETFFLMLGLPMNTAKEMAEQYEYEAIEVKETSHRSDGVFRPKEPSLPLYFVEVQFYRLPSVFADLLVKAFSYLKRHDPFQSFVAIVLFATKSLEPKDLGLYRQLVDCGLIRRYYLDELPESTDAPLGLAIINLLRQSENEAAATARQLIARVKHEVADDSLRVNLIQLIETVIIYKLANLSREEIQAMLQVDDIRETRVYKEAQEEERARLQERQRQRDRNAVVKMAASTIAPEKIAEFLDLDIEFVRSVLAQANP